MVAPGMDGSKSLENLGGSCNRDRSWGKTGEEGGGGNSIRAAISHVVVRRELRARKFPPENRARNISRHIREKRRERAS